MPPRTQKPSRQPTSHATSQPASQPASQPTPQPTGITRRQFLQFSSLAAGAASLVPLFGRLPRPAPARTGLNRLTADPGTFNQMPAATIFGPPSDLSSGWDGTLWALAPAGAPCLFDPDSGQWTPFGAGLDAVAYFQTDPFPMLFYVLDDEFILVTDANTIQAPQSIADFAPQLPVTFQQGIDGAALIGAALFLFAGGRYANLNLSNPSPVSLNSIANWPTSSAWKDGLVDCVASGADNVAMLLRDQEYLLVQLDGDKLALAAGSWPQPVSAFFGPGVAQLLAGGETGAIFFTETVAPEQPVHVLVGPTHYTFSAANTAAAPSASYVATGAWPASWHPQLVQAPVGSYDNLWSVTTAGAVVLYGDEDTWGPIALPSGSALSVAVAADGGIYVATTDAIWTVEPAGGGFTWNQIATAPAGVTFAQIVAGDVDHVWLLAAGGQAYSLIDPGGNVAFVPETRLPLAADLAAGYDGTLWAASPGEASLYRLISEGATPAESLPVGGAAQAVTKVAASAYGAAWCLADSNSGTALAFTYNSSASFKSEQSYATQPYHWLESGLGRVFLVDGDGSTAPAAVVALDFQTGREAGRYTAPVGQRFSSPIYDPGAQAVYVAFAPADDNDASSFGGVLSLDARSLQPNWTVVTAAGVDAPPLFDGRLLYYGDRQANLYCTDVTQIANGAPTLVWTLDLGLDNVLCHAAPPVFAGTGLHLPLWTFGSGQTAVTLVSIVPDGSAASSLYTATLPTALAASDFVPARPICAMLPVFGPSGSSAMGVWVNAGAAIYGFSVGEPATATITPPANAHYSSGLAYQDGTLWVGTDDGQLYSYSTLNPTAPSTPFVLPAPGPVYSTPLLTTNSSGETIVFFGSSAPSLNALWVFQPDIGAAFSIPTGQSSVTILGRAVFDGVVYAGGSTANQPGNGASGEIFAINVDDTLQDQRAFVIEAQLMQDYDEDTSSNLQTYSRYQTHLTLQANGQTPVPYAPVRLWAEDATPVLLNGEPFTLNPDTPVDAQTDEGGVLTVASGYVAGGGTDNTDIFASPLRIWAPFMNPSERVVFYADGSFAQRMAAATAQPLAQPDPDTINLQTAVDYNNNQLFGSSSQAQQMAATMAQVMGQANMSSSAANSGLVAATVDGRRPKYVAYASLVGIDYFHADLPAVRTLRRSRPFSIGVKESGEFTFYNDVPGAHADIDALAGVAPIEPLEGLFSWLKKLWDDIKAGVKKITQLIVSFGNTIYAAIQYIENGITYAVKRVVKTVEDAAIVVGGFFETLGKDIENVIQALSILFDLAQINDTHKILAAQFKNYIGQLPDALAKAGAQIGIAIGNLENDISNIFCQVRQQFDPNLTCASLLAAMPGAAPTPINGLQGAGADANTVFSVAPQNNPGSRSSKSVQSTWLMHKTKQNQKAAQATTAAGAGAAASNPFTDFITAFVQSLKSDGTLSQALSQTAEDFRRTFEVKSLDQFLQTAVADLLDLLEDLLIGSLSLIKAFVAGFFQVAADFVTFVAGSSGLITGKLDIPIISSLYKKITGDDLTFLDLCLLVGAIPVTILYRLIEGEYFADDFKDSAGSASGATPSGVTAPQPLIRAFGLLTGITYFFEGILGGINSLINGLSDAGADIEKVPVLGRIAQGISFMTAITTLPVAAMSSPQVLDWASWGLNVLLFGVNYIPDFMQPIMNMALGIITLITNGMQLRYETGFTTLAFAGDLMSLLPSIGAPLSLASGETLELTTVLLFALTLFGNWGAAGVAIANTVSGWDAVSAPLPAYLYEQYLPFAAKAG